MDKLSNKDINTLVAEYRTGDVSAAEKLLEGFHNLVGKYLNLFFHGRYSPGDQDIVRFLSMCGKVDIGRTADIIRSRLRKYDAEELIGIARVALLDTAKRYDNISNSYKFVLYEYIRNMLWEDFLDNFDDLVEYPAPQKSVNIDDDWVKGRTAGAGFSELTEQQRRLIQLCYNDGVPDIHVARLVGITVYSLKKEKQTIKDILARELNITQKSEV